ncbi:helix-turn-helix domain-containing protein [Rhodococcus sp. MSC1_016]|uniref:helix-turn-helix domain-containing protein n=1 Tax=Rhodococcus sp. MSC1_016 TaxID=2909266 RepID=UPI00202E963A|nr:helix-turn-helix domain-containing protein [Rhodococcus sp. MSC1_016]
MGEIQRLDGVFLSRADARTLVEALTLFRDLLPRMGSRPTARLDQLRIQLASAVRASDSDARVSDSADNADPRAWFGHEFIDTAAAATLLGCSAANVRDLARRGTLPAVHVGGRWLVAADAVRTRAA